ALGESRTRKGQAGPALPTDRQRAPPASRLAASVPRQPCTRNQGAPLCLVARQAQHGAKTHPAPRRGIPIAQHDGTAVALGISQRNGQSQSRTAAPRAFSRRTAAVEAYKHTFSE